MHIFNKTQKFILFIQSKESKEKSNKKKKPAGRYYEPRIASNDEEKGAKTNDVSEVTEVFTPNLSATLSGSKPRKGNKRKGREEKAETWNKQRKLKKSRQVSILEYN